MDNYRWGNYPMTDEQKAMLLYTGQQLQQQGMLPNSKRFVNYQNPINGMVGQGYEEFYPVMDDRTINTVLEYLKGGYKPAISARNEYNQLPKSYKNSLVGMFNYR